MSDRDKPREPVTFDTGEASPARSTGTSGGFNESPIPFKSQPTSGAGDLEEAGEAARRRNLGNLPTSMAELDTRQGNYILSFGYPYSGKSNFQSFLARWIETGGQFRSSVGRIDSSDNSTRLINLWREDWKANRFVPVTDTGMTNITELRLTATPLHGNKESLTFGFLEMSGEEQKRIIPEDGTASSMSEPLKRFLRNKDINAILVLFVDPEQQVGRPLNDTIFMNLLDYMDANFSKSEVERLSLLLLVPKPAQALAVLRQLPEARGAYDGIDHVEELNTDLLRLYLELTIPGTFARVTEWPGKWNFARFFLGEPVEGEERYENPSFEDIAKIFAWMYKVFLGRELGKSRWERFNSFFKVSE